MDNHKLHLEKIDRNIYRLRIKELIKIKGLKQSELSNIMGVNSATLSSYINEKRTVGILKLIDFAKALNCEFSDLFERTGWCSCICEESKKEYDAGIIESDINKTMYLFSTNRVDAVNILSGKKSISPNEYSILSYRLGNRAFLIMPNISVKI